MLTIDSFYVIIIGDRYYERNYPQWIVDTYSQRNWVEVFYREAKGWLG